MRTANLDAQFDPSLYWALHCAHVILLVFCRAQAQMYNKLPVGVLKTLKVLDITDPDSFHARQSKSQSG